MNTDFFEQLAEKYPFITLCSYASTEYVGIIQNQDDLITTIYDFGAIQGVETKRVFLELANTWWWESNRQIPINMFVRDRFMIFKRYLRIFSMKETEILQGPVVNLKDLMNKRVKRRTIQLVKHA